MIVIQQSMDANSVSQTNEISESSETVNGFGLQKSQHSVHRGQKMSTSDFTIIGENIHTTRVLMRNGRRIVKNKDGSEAILYRGFSGDESFMTIPDHFKETQVYQEGRVKHFMVAVRKGMSEIVDDQREGEDYILAEIKRQESCGSDFLDLNIDELSYELEVQKQAMTWLVGFYSAVASVPPSIDSSSSDILKAGLEEYSARGQPQGPPLVNSASFERVEVLDLVAEHETHVIVTAAGSSNMPSDEFERVHNAQLMLNHCESIKIAKKRIHVDPLLFPIAVDQTFGNHYLTSVQLMRKEFGNEVRISGGLSNVSFGLPARRLINDTFIRLAMEAGTNSGIVNPVESRIERVMSLDMNSERVKIAKNMLLGEDEFCMNFIKSFREGKLTE